MVFWFTVGVLVLMTVLLIMEVYDSSFILFGAMLLLLLGKVITPKEAFSGFSNQGMLAIGFLYVLAYAVQSTGVLNEIAQMLLGHPKDSDNKRLLRFLYPVAGASAFMNNTPIVAMFIPIVRKWCRQFNISPSKILLPLSYATILGGMCTLIGTSTNLVVHGFLLEKGYKGFSFFELGTVGLPVMLLGVLFIVFVLQHLLPERKEASIQLGESTREFVVALKITPAYTHADSTVEEAGLRHLHGLFLFQIERNGQFITPVKPSEVLRINDRLFFTGVPSTIVELQKEPGLEVLKDVEYDLKNYDSNKIKTFEVVVSTSSPLVGQTVKDSDFRQYYGAVILAIHRNGHRINEKIGSIRIEEGDTLLLLAPKEFYKKWYHSRDFLLISNSDEVPSRPKSQSVIIILTLFGLIISVTAGFLPMIVAAATAAFILFLTRSVTPKEAFEAVNWRVLLLIASSFGLAAGIENSGLAKFLADVLVQISAPFGLAGIIAIVILSTMLYSEFVTNSASAAIFFPIAMAIAAETGVSLIPLAYAIVFGASSGFATPIGYQTNMMVYGPGGYKFSDYVRVGIPLGLFVLVTATALIYWKFM